MASQIPLNAYRSDDPDTMHRLIEAVPFAVFVKDAQSRFVAVNTIMADMLGRPARELIGYKDHDLVPHEQAEAFRRDDLRVLQSGQDLRTEELFTAPDGELKTLQSHKKRMTLPDGSHLVVGTLIDISDQRSAEAVTSEQATRDALTGLYNRHHFEQLVDAICEDADPDSDSYALMLVNLDTFKPINDAYGLTIGDIILCEVASKLSRILRRGDNARSGDIVARLGGDEFAIWCRQDQATALTGITRVVHRILADLRRPINAGQVSLGIGATIGVARYPIDGTDMRSLLRAADIAMRRGKSETRGGFRTFEARLGEETRELARLEADLRGAIASDQIVPHYQPVMSLPDNRLVGFEVLARWQHQTRGLLLPDQFISIAERMGIITDLTKSVLRQAAADALCWNAQLRLSLNLSPLQLSDPTLPDTLLEVLDNVGLSPARLEVEITEKALTGDPDVSRANLRALHRAGVSVALDDFGTGFSGFNHLRDLTFDKIKIDRSLIRSVVDDDDCDKIVSAIFGLARSLGRGAVAEGIEDEKTLAHLVGQGAQCGQGNHFGRPVAAEMVPAMIARLARVASPAPRPAAVAPVPHEARDSETA
ncbi:putative bifunctional diguanylate cyclase/phosphodiesterase [Devosia sp.]|uniref:putative bifunctional diguanylate cyclase/phosphodiesterase n=1 Tax=Devosia sp. TaxID=1871048 RepID=UPI003A91C228